MKIAIYYENRLGRNDGPPLYWCKAMKDLGHEVTHFCSAHEPNKEWGKFDLHVWVDWGEDALTEMLTYKPISMKTLHPSMYVTSDTHLGFDYRFEKAKEFDYVFCNQIRAKEEFDVKSNGNKMATYFLPHAVDTKAYPASPVCIKKYDIGFVGFVTFEKRAKMLDELFRAFPNFWYGQRLFEDAAEIYRKSKIVFNTAAVDDINMRVFEVLATGAFLLTEYVPTLNKLFKDGEHLVTYKTMDEAIEKAQFYLDHPDKREMIAKQGHDEVMRKHTYQHRVDEALKVIF